MIQLSDLLVVTEDELITGETLPLLVSVTVERCIDFICWTASSRSLVSSADFCEVNLGGLGRLTRGETDPLILIGGSDGDERDVELEVVESGDKLMRGGMSSAGSSGLRGSKGKITLLGGGVGLPASLVGWGT